MTHANSTEQLIEVAARLKDSVAALYEAYGLLPTAIEKEHKAIQSSDFAAVETTRLEKEATCARIETCFQALTAAGEKLSDLSSQLPSGARIRPASLSECVAALDSAAAHCADETFAKQVLSHQIAGLKRLVEDFKGRYSVVKPQIEANRFLVGTMLHNFQESYRFWQEIKEKVALGYNSQGIRKATGQSSGFRIKA